MSMTAGPAGIAPGTVSVACSFPASSDTRAGCVRPACGDRHGLERDLGGVQHDGGGRLRERDLDSHGAVEGRRREVRLDADVVVLGSDVAGKPLPEARSCRQKKADDGNRQARGHCLVSQTNGSCGRYTARRGCESVPRRQRVRGTDRGARRRGGADEPVSGTRGDRTGRARHHGRDV